jgi:periplasmic divalent cation tolerance protein
VNEPTHIVVITTCPNEAEAARLSSELIERHLAACVQLSQIKSTYRWQGVVETTDEVRLMIKSKASDYSEIESLIKSTHSYDNPEVIAIPIVDGSQMYLGWIDQETKRTTA